MGEILEGFRGAIALLFSFDQEVYQIILLSLYVSLTSTFIAGLLAMPSGILLATYEFPHKDTVVRGIYTLMSLPPVIAGLVVFLMISRRGPLGFLELAYTPGAMILAQTCLVFPIITGVLYNSAKGRVQRIRQLGITLGASSWGRFLLVVKEMRISILAALVTGYGRAISEVGAVMIVGGNIRGHTRVMTTTIAMLQSMGDYDLAIAIGLVLLLLSFVINSILYHYQQGRGEE